MTSKVKCETEELVFRATVASFYEIDAGHGGELIQEFAKWLKEKGKANEFLVFDVRLHVEKKT